MGVSWDELMSFIATLMSLILTLILMPIVDLIIGVVRFSIVVVTSTYMMIGWSRIILALLFVLLILAPHRFSVAAG